MPKRYEFDTKSVRPPNNPAPETQLKITFVKPYVTRPRLPNGLRELDIDKKANVRVKTDNQYFTQEWADCHIITWADTTLYSAVEDFLVLAPADVDFQTGEHMRSPYTDPNAPTTARVNFERPFPTPPKVVVFFNLLDIDSGHNWRLKTFATDIDEKGFTIHIETWSDTVLHAAQACWVAYPEDRRHIFSTSVNTSDIRPWNQPQLRQGEQITFDANTVEFWKEPEVFVGLNMIDLDHGSNLRIKAYVDNVSRTGLTWNIDSWYDSILYQGGASIIAFNP